VQYLGVAEPAISPMLTHTVVYRKDDGAVTAIAQKHEATPPAAKARRRVRQYQRVAVRCGCWLEHEDATVFGTTVDIGCGGLFLRTALPMVPGLDVRVTLRIPGFPPVVADGQVVRRIGPQDGPRPGLGVRFERLREGDEALRDFLGTTLADASADF
jgi:hypothetical protein